VQKIAGCFAYVASRYVELQKWQKLGSSSQALQQSISVFKIYRVS
jgi:hypothetical protein